MHTVAFSEITAATLILIDTIMLYSKKKKKKRISVALHIRIRERECFCNELTHKHTQLDFTANMYLQAHYGTNHAPGSRALI